MTPLRSLFVELAFSYNGCGISMSKCPLALTSAFSRRSQWGVLQRPWKAGPYKWQGMRSVPTDGRIHQRRWAAIKCGAPSGQPGCAYKRHWNQTWSSDMGILPQNTASTKMQFNDKNHTKKGLIATEFISIPFRTCISMFRCFLDIQCPACNTSW